MPFSYHFYEQTRFHLGCPFDLENVNIWDICDQLREDCSIYRLMIFWIQS
jgi:hypothetical protein